MFSLKYNNVPPPPFVKITRVNQYILPRITHSNSKITGSYGNVDGGVTYGDKVFQVFYKIVYDGEHDDAWYLDAMALWLYDYSQSVPKFQLDDSGEYYRARVSDATDFSDALVYGEGSITFTACNPRRYVANETSINLATSGNSTVNYTGYVPACPVFTVQCPAGTSTVKITNQTTGDYVLVKRAGLSGELIIDCNKKFVALDGVKDMTMLDAQSDWITLQRHDNIINVTVEGTAVTSVNIKFTVCK